MNNNIGHLLVTRWAMALAALALVYWQAPLMAAAAHVQNKQDSFTICQSIASCVVTFTSNVTTGNTVAAVIGWSAGSGTTLSVSDATNGTWTSIVQNDANGQSLHAFRNATGGFTQVTVTWTGSSDNSAYVGIYEISGLSNTASITSGQATEASSTSHNCSSTGLTGTGFILCGGYIGTAATKTPPTSWTNDESLNSFGVAMRYVGAFSSEQGAYTVSSAGTSRTAMALFPEASNCKTLAVLGVGC